MIAFAITIVVLIADLVDGTIVALPGTTVMAWFGEMTDVDAFGLVDRNVMAITISI